MRAMLRTAFVTVVALSTCAAWSLSSAQTAASKSTQVGMIQACSLMTNAEVEKIIGRRLFNQPEPKAVVGGTGSACTYGEGSARIVLFQGDGSEERWNAFLKSLGGESERKYPVAGVGEGAYALFPRPRSESEEPVAFLVVKVGRDTLGVSMQLDKSMSPNAVPPELVTLTKAVLGKLR